MPPSTPRRRPVAAAARAASVLVVAAALAACGGGGGSDDGAVPTLITTPVPSSTATTSTSVATSAPQSATTADAVSTSTSVDAAPSTSTATTGTGTGDGPSGPGSAVPTPTSDLPGPTGASTTPTSAAATTTTLDIEPPHTTPPPTAPVPTAAQPPDTIGGRDEDYLLTPESIVGLQFGASRSTVVDRFADLLGNPLRVDPLAGCPGGPATALQWLNAGVIVTADGLAYYLVAMDFDLYGEAPIPFWHTRAGVAVGADRAALDAAYAGAVAYDSPVDSSVTFTITSGPDAGIEGTLVNDVVQSMSAGASTC